MDAAVSAIAFYILGCVCLTCIRIHVRVHDVLPAKNGPQRRYGFAYGVGDKPNGFVSNGGSLATDSGLSIALTLD